MNRFLDRDTAGPVRIQGRFTVVISKYIPAYEGDVRYEYQLTVVKVLSVKGKIKTSAEMSRMSAVGV
jgi:hypothetical protein